MANKNTRSLRKAIQAAGRKGAQEVSIDKPVFNYHNDNKGKFIQVNFPTARANSDGLISANKRRNMAQRVYRNSGGPSGGMSVTVHEPALRGEYVKHKNHGYIEYRQFAA